MTNTNLLSKVSVVVLGVSDISASLSFYREQLGMEIRGHAGDIAFIAAGPITLMLNEDLGRAIQPIAGAVEVVFAVDSVGATREALRQRGCAFTKEPAEVTPGSWAATFKDPDGHLLTLFGPR